MRDEFGDPIYPPIGIPIIADANLERVIEDLKSISIRLSVGQDVNEQELIGLKSELSNAIQRAREVKNGLPAFWGQTIDQYLEIFNGRGGVWAGLPQYLQSDFAAYRAENPQNLSFVDWFIAKY